jgi:hypothetical protein
MNRFAAFAIHLGISLAVFAVLAALVVFVWYPDFFFEADGGWQGMRIIILVDLVAGPLLTLIVYKPGKPSLRMDLTIIAIFQVACLAAGTWVVWSERPLALVYSDGTFFSMTGGDFEEAKVDWAPLKSIEGPWPKRVAVQLDSDPTRESATRLQAFQSGRPLRTYVEYYQPLTSDMLDMAREAVPPAELEALDKASHLLPEWLARHGGSIDDYAFFKFATRYQYAFLGVRRSDGEIVGLLETQGQL